MTIETTFRARCTRCTRTASVHMRSRTRATEVMGAVQVFDDYTTLVTWHGRHVDGNGARCQGGIDPAALDAGVKYLRESAVIEASVDAVRPTRDLYGEPEDVASIFRNRGRHAGTPARKVA